MNKVQAIGTRVKETLSVTGIEWWKKLAVRLGFYAAGCFLLRWAAKDAPYLVTFALAVVLGGLGIGLHHRLQQPVGHGGTVVKLIVWTLFIEAGVIICLTQHWRV